MKWSHSETRILPVIFLPVVLMTFFLFGGTNFTNDSLDCIEYGGQCFAPVDEFVEEILENATSESEYVDVDSFLNTTEESNETVAEPAPPPDEINSTESGPSTESNETTEEIAQDSNETSSEDAFPEENETLGEEFVDVDELINFTEEANETVEEFVEVEDFLNLTNQTELQEINESFGNETLAPLNLTAVNDSISGLNTTNITNALNVTNVTNRPYSIPFTLLGANGLSLNASVSFTKDGKEVPPVSASPILTSSSADAATTKFGIAPGKYDMRIAPASPDSSLKDGALPVPVSQILFKGVEITLQTKPILKLEGLSARATPFGKNTRQAYAIDPTDFNFTEGELTVTARGTELYKCADWIYDEQKCTGKWIKIMNLTPGENYTVIIDAADPAYAEYNASLGAPRCANYTSPCIANSSLLRSRDSIWFTSEPNQPNTVDACTDGGSGWYQIDESVENITIESLTAPMDTFNAGDTVRVNATVYCWSTGTNDNINFVYSSSTSSTSWSVVNYTDPCPGGGFQQVSRTFTLANNPGEHVIRVINQYNGVVSATCGAGAYDDNDDLAFQVNGTPPTVNLVSPAEGALTDGNTPYFTFNVTQASTCTLHIDGEPDQGSISAAADTNYAIQASPLSGAHTWQVICGAISSETRNFTQSSRKAIFEDTFTSGGGFAPDAPNTAPWQRGNATQMGGCHLDSSCAGTNLAADYFPNGPYDDMSTKAVPMNLSNYANVTLTFYHYRYFETAVILWDAGVVEINNGTGWARLTPEGGYSGTVDNTAGSSLANQQAYGYHGSSWELEIFNISNYSSNENVTFRFYFAADQAVADRGWFIDDVRVFGDPLVDYGITSAWDTSDSQVVIPNETDTFYANYTYFNGTSISGPPGTCNITTNATYNMAYNAASGLYEFNQSFPAAVSAIAIISCQKNSSFILSQESESYTITGVVHTNNLTCWEAPDPTYPPYPGGYTPTFLYCNYSYLNDTPVDSDGVCSWRDNQPIEYYFFGNETFNMREKAFHGELQLLFSFDDVWSDLESLSEHGKIACYNQTAGTMVVDMCLDYLNTSKEINYNLNASNDSANCFPVGTMTCAEFSWMSGLPNGTFSWAKMAINMTKFNQTLASIGDPSNADVQLTYWCPDCNFSLFTTPYNTSQYAANLVTLHHFDEFVNNGSDFISVDAAGNLNFTRVGTVYTSPGQVNKSVNFSNAHGYLIAPDVTGFDVLSSITVEAYVKVEQHTTTRRTIFGKYALSPIYKCGPNMDQPCLNQRSSRLYLDKEGHLGVDFSSDGKEEGKVTLRDPVEFPLNEWVQVGFVFDGTHISLYRDGHIVAETDEFSGMKIFDSTAPWLVGADDAGQSGFANHVLVDELRVLDRALSNPEFVSNLNSDFWLVKTQAIPGSQFSYISESVSGNKRNFSRVNPERGENLVKLSVVGNSLNMTFNASTGLYTSTRGSAYGFHPNIYTINYSCSKSGAESQETSSPWTIAALAPNCSIDGYLPNVGIGQYQYVNWSFNSNIPPQMAYFNITHEDGHVFTFYENQLVNVTAAINHAPGTANITCYVENENSTYTSTVQFNITAPTECFWAAAQNTVYTLGGDMVNTKADSACITVEASNITIDCNGSSITGNGTDTTLAILLSSVENITIKNCRMSNYTYGIYGSEGTTATIQNNTFWNLSESGILITDSGGACSIWNNTFENISNVGAEIYNSTGSDISWNNFTNASWGIRLGYSDGNVIHNNNIINSTAMGIGFCVESSGNDVRNNNIFNFDPALCPVDYGHGISLGFNWPYAELNASNNFVQDNIVSGYTLGIQTSNSTNNTFRYNVVENCTRGLEFYRGGNHKAYSNNISNNNDTGIYLNATNYNTVHDNIVSFNKYSFNVHAGSNYNNLSNNLAYNTTDSGFEVTYSAHNRFINNTAFNNTHSGISLLGAFDTFVDPSYFCGNTIGINITNSNDTVVDDSVACNNTQYGIYIYNSNNTLINRSKTYNNSMDFFINNTAGYALILNFTSLVFDNPSNSLQKYTNLSLYDSVADSTAYSINWTSQTAPPNYISFANKWINISAQAGTPSIDEVVWQWLDSEVSAGGYNETKFELAKYNSSWAIINNTPDVSANTLTQYNMNPASDYGILENKETCPVIDSATSYSLTANMVGAPNSVAGVSEISQACVIIASDNVDFSCNGYDITNNGTANAAGIIINGSVSEDYTNVTIRDCPGISEYEIGAYIHRSSQDRVQNITSHNNTNAGIYLYYSSSNNLTNNLLINNTWHGINMSTSHSNLVQNNNITNNTIFGLTFHDCNDASALHNTISGNGNDGIAAFDSNNTNISYNTLFHSAGDEIFTRFCDGSYIAYNQIDNAYDPSLFGDDIYNNTVYLNGASSDAMDLHGSSNTLVIGNNGSNVYAGIRCDLCSDMRIENNILNNSVFGIGSSNMTNSNISSNKLSTSSSSCIYLIAYVSNNTFFDNTVFNATHYGFYIRNVSYDEYINNTAYNNTLFGMYVLSSPNNTFTNNTAYNNTRGIHLNMSSNNLLTLNNVSNNTEYGISFHYSNYTAITHNTISGNTYDGVEGWTSNYANVSFNTADYNGDDSIEVYVSTGSWITNNNINYPGRDGINIPNNTGTQVLNNDIFDSGQIGVRCDNGQDILINNTNITLSTAAIGSNSLFNSTISHNRLSNSNQAIYFIESSSYNTMSYNAVYGHTTIGIYLRDVDHHTFINNTIYDSITRGIDIWNCTDIEFYNTTLYNNTEDVYIRNTGIAPMNYTMVNTTFRDVVGSAENYTTLSISDSVTASSTYAINWSSNSSSLPANRISFRQKFVNISTQAGTPSIDEVAWNWLDLELTGYTESKFELWKYNASGWNLRNDTPDVSANMLTQYNLNPASEYGILQNAECRDDDGDGANYSYVPGACAGQIEDCNDSNKYLVPPYNGLRLEDQDQTYTLCPGTYYINASDGPIIRIDEYNITLDCNGTTMIGNGRGSLVDGYWSEMEIKNCIIHNYSECMDFGWGENVLIQNNTLSGCSCGLNLENFKHGKAHENTILQSVYGIYLERANDSSIFNNTVESQITGYYASNQYINYSGEIFDNGEEHTMFVPSDIFVTGGKPCVVEADGDSLHACPAFDGTTNLSVILNDLSPFGFGSNATIMMDGEFNNCSDVDNWWDTNVGSHPPCHYACVLYTANGAGNDYTLNESCYNATLNVSQGLTYPPYVDYGPINTYGIELEYSDAILIHNNIFNTTYPASDDNNGSFNDYFSSFSPVTYNGFNYTGEPPWHNYTRFLYSIEDGEMEWSNEVDRDNYIFTDDAIDGTHSFGMFVANFSNLGNKYETVYFDAAEMGWNNCLDVENDLYSDLNPGDCKAFCANILTANGYNQNYSFDSTCLNTTFNITSGFTYPPYLNYTNYAVKFNDWNTSQQLGPNIIGGQDIGGNFYSDYTGIDANGDGIGETPYPIAGGGAIDQLPLTNNIGGCRIINSSGVYQLNQNAIGAPYNGTPVATSACVKIESSDVEFDCNGYNITNNGTAGITCGVFLKGSLTNVTLKNCPGISQYSQGVCTHDADTSLFTNITSHSNTYGFYIFASYNNTIRNCTAYNSSSNGFYFYLGSHNNTISNSTSYDSLTGFAVSYSSNNNTLINNTAFNNSYGFLVSFSSNGSILRSNTARGNTVGMFIDPSYNNSIIENNIYSNSQYGLHLEDSHNNTIRNNTAYNNSMYGIYLNSSTYNHLANNRAHNNSLYGFYLSSSNNNALSLNFAYNNTIAGILTESSSHNNFENNSVYNNSNYGIYLQSNSNFNTLTNNSFFTNGLYGVHSFISHNNSFYRNNAYSNTFHGFYLTQSSDNNLTNNTARNNLNYGFFLSSCTGNNLIENLAHSNNAHNFFLSLNSDNNTLFNNTAHSSSGGPGNNSGFHVLESNYNNFTSNTAYNNTQHGFFIQQSNFTALSGNRVYNNTFDGIQLVTWSTNNTISGNRLYNNTQHGIWLDQNCSNNTFMGNLAYNNTMNGIQFTHDSNENNLTGNNVTGNTGGGLYFGGGTQSNTAQNNYVCFNSLDISNSSALTTGTLDTCDSWSNWHENGHSGCTFRCTEVWQRFYGEVNGSLMLAPNQADIFYSWLWNGDSGAVYVISGNATIDWPSLVALGRNTTQQNSTNDFTELDTALGISAEPDNVNYTYSYDGSNPNLTMNVTIFEHFVPYVPLANSTFTPGDDFFTGIAWDSSQDTSGNGQFDIADNEDVVFGSGIDGSATYDYEIMVPATLATYKGGNTVEFWVELD